MILRRLSLLVFVALIGAGSACTKKPPVVGSTGPAAPNPFPGGAPAAGSSASAIGDRPAPPPVLPPDSVRGTPLGSTTARPLEEINGPESPLRPVLFAYDSDELSEDAKRALTANADVLKANRTWVVTVEGHCDERGSAEYNLALGDRRALAARNFLVTLGIPVERLRTVSYGQEFPFDPGHGENAWTKNRRAHLMVTGQ